MKTWIHMLSILLLGFSVQAQVEFSASVNQKEVALGQRFAVEFKVNQQGQDFKAPNFHGLQVLGGPNTSVSTFMDNTGTRYNLTYSYVLKALKTGEYTIDPAFIRVDGRTYRTESITIKVVEQKAERQDAPKDVFLKAYVSDRKVYQGEPLYANYRLYFRNEVFQHSFQEEPDFTGFYRENIEQTRIETKEEYVNGSRYYSADLRKMVLIPQKTGKFDMGNIAMTIPVRVQSRRRDIFGFPISRSENRDLLTPFPDIEVLPLPSTGRPMNFSGAVGQFEMEAELSDSEIDTDGSLSLRLTIKGDGNIKLAELPKIEFPSAFEVFDPEIKENSTVGTYGMRGYKTVEYLLVPRYGGEYKIGPIEFSYFDPKKEKYIRIQSEEFTVKVRGGSLAPQEKQSGIMNPRENEQVNFINKEILFIKTKALWRKANAPFLGSTLFWILIAVPFFIATAGLLLWLRKRQELEQGDLLKVQRAGKVARKRLTKAQKALKENNPEVFYSELETAIWGYFEDKFNMGRSSLNKEELQSQLKDLSVPEDHIQTILGLLQQAEMARFTGLKAEAAQKDYQATAQVLTEMEKLL